MKKACQEVAELEGLVEEVAVRMFDRQTLVVISRRWQ